MNSEIEKLKSAFDKELASATASKDLEQIKIKFLGKKGPIAALMVHLKDCTPDQRPLFGKAINDLKEIVSSEIERKLSALNASEQSFRLNQEDIDISLPGRSQTKRGRHLISAMIEEVLDLLVSMGFSVQCAPELDSEYYNYEGLNYPEDHPARDMQDTYYITKDILMRSHTSNVQQRVMEAHTPPIRIVSAGKCYRNETISSRSHVIFHQFEAVYIDKHVTFQDLLATKEEFYSRLFKQKVSLRIRPSYFPFVEPGLEIDVNCTSCGGKGCSLCKHTGWLEVCGAGMIHPNVLKEGGIDPDVYSGFAWGGGIERLCLLRYGIPDIRLFMENDIRFLEQFF